MPESGHFRSDPIEWFHTQLNHYRPPDPAWKAPPSRADPLGSPAGRISADAEAPPCGLLAQLTLQEEPFGSIRHAHGDDRSQHTSKTGP